MHSTVFCAVLNPATGQLSYASAGHPPGILTHPDGRVELLDHGHSPALGLLVPDHPRSEAVTQVPEGAALLLYTRWAGGTARPGPRREHHAGCDAAPGRPPRHRCPNWPSGCMTSLAPGQGCEDDVALLLYSRPAPLNLQLSRRSGRASPWFMPASCANRLGQLSMDTLVAQDVLIAACEACANAIEHGYRGSPSGTVRLRVQVTGPDVVITVSDCGRWRPAPTPERDRGHGLRLIRATMRDVEITANRSRHHHRDAGRHVVTCRAEASGLICPGQPGSVECAAAGTDAAGIRQQVLSGRTPQR